MGYYNIDQQEFLAAVDAAADAQLGRIRFGDVFKVFVGNPQKVAQEVAVRESGEALQEAKDLQTELEYNQRIANPIPAPTPAPISASLGIPPEYLAIGLGGLLLIGLVKQLKKPKKEDNAGSK